MCDPFVLRYYVRINESDLFIVSLICNQWITFQVFRKNKLQEKQITYASYLNYDSGQFSPGSCFLNGDSTDFKLFNKTRWINYTKKENNILLMGDSHAAHWYSAFNKLLHKQKNISQVTSIGCKPIVAYSYLGDKCCADLIAWAYEEFIPTHRFDKIILSARWKKKELPHLIDSIKKLAKYTDEIIILGSIIEYKRSLPKLLALNDTEEKMSINREYFAIKKIDDLYSKNISETSARYISILNVICATEFNCTTVTETDIPMQFDYGHLTHHGGITLLKRILDRKLL